MGLLARGLPAAVRPRDPGADVVEVERAKRGAVVGLDARDGVGIALAVEFGDVVEEIVAVQCLEALRDFSGPVGLILERVVELGVEGAGRQRGERLGERL